MYPHWQAVLVHIIARRKVLGGPVEFYIADTLTKQLLDWWIFWHSPLAVSKNFGNIYMFPKVDKKLRMDFTKQFSYDNHRDACKQSL